jgi:NAD(P)-dependent dehydrogenase (short-subunit alcohol dehydrogenase family)
MAELNRRVAVVTGAARGMGEEVALTLAADGWDLVLVDRCADDPGLRYALASPEELDAVVASCNDGGGRAVGIVGDVRDQAALDRAVGTAVEQFGGLDAAVAAAGCIAGGAPTWETDDSVWATMIGVNAEGVWRLARAAVPALLARPAPRHGRFVAISPWVERASRCSLPTWRRSTRSTASSAASRPSGGEASP